MFKSLGTKIVIDSRSFSLSDIIEVTPYLIKPNEEEIAVYMQKPVADIKEAIKDGYNVFISGMAPGVDIWAAEIVLRLREKGADIKLICASPFEGFEKRWPDWERRYNAILEKADLVRFICKGNIPGVHQIRNEWMVDHATRVIAVFNGEKSGTKNTIDYANRVGVEIKYITG